MKDFNFSDYLIPATILIGPATTLYTYFRNEKTGDKDKDKLINENKKLKRNRLSNIVYGNLGYLTSILAAYAYWQNRLSLNSKVASLKSMITALQGENSDNSAKLERLQEDYLTLQARMQNEIVRSQAISNNVVMGLVNNVGVRAMSAFHSDAVASATADMTDLYNHPDLGEIAMSVATGTSAIDVYKSMQGKGMGIIKKWLPSLGLLPVIALLTQQPQHFTNLLNEKFKGIHESLGTAGTSIGLTSGDINRLVFDGQVYNNFIDLFQIFNDKTIEQFNKTIFEDVDINLREKLAEKLKKRQKEANSLTYEKLNRFERLKYHMETGYNFFGEDTENRLQTTYTSPPPNFESMGYSLESNNMLDTTPLMTPSEMREIADTNRSLRNLPPIITEDVNRSLLKRKREAPLTGEDIPRELMQYNENNPPKLGQEPYRYIDANIINRLLSIFPGLILTDNFPHVTSPIRERAYYRNMKRFNKDEIFARLNEVTDGPESFL